MDILLCSVWTVDLAYLLQKFSVTFSYFTVTLGANPKFSVETFYKVIPSHWDATILLDYTHFTKMLAAVIYYMLSWHKACYENWDFRLYGHEVVSLFASPNVIIQWSHVIIYSCVSLTTSLDSGYGIMLYDGVRLWWGCCC